MEKIKPKAKPKEKVEYKKIEKMIYDLFRVCDGWVDLKSWTRFENDFSIVTKKYGFDLHQIYFGKSYAEMKRTYQRYEELKKWK